MEKLEPFCLNQENFFMLSMMPIIMDAPQLQPLLMDKGSFLAALKDRLEFGRSQNKPNLWRLL